MRWPRMARLAVRAVGKPPQVVAYRAAQELRLWTLRISSGWRRLEHRVDEWWNPERVSSFSADRDRPVVLAPDGAEAIRCARQQGLLQHDALVDYGRNAMQRRFSVLGAPVPDVGNWPWHADWRTDYTWEPKYFRQYNFYGGVEPRDEGIFPDVKYPWELSRLFFLIPMLQASVILSESEPWKTGVRNVLVDWKRRNRLAYSVVWNPMEVSMRGLNLVLALDLVLSSGDRDPALLQTFLTLISTHAEFLSRTMEYTDVRGNHYAANVVALLLLASALRGHYPDAERWLNAAANTLHSEIPLQFLRDGVNQEKSIPYHRLVAELFLVGAIAMGRAGIQLCTEARNRMVLASSYSSAYVRPDGLTPVVGDNDDSRVLVFDPVETRDHRILLAVAAAYFGDYELLPYHDHVPAAIPWLLGQEGLKIIGSCPSRADATRAFYPDGGVVVIKTERNYLWMDVGEVGLRGRGGHGHNDLLSFELVIDSVPVIVDPGSYVYTSDPAARDLFRSSAYHNTLTVDGIEMADLGSMWSIKNQALPFDVAVDEEGQCAVIEASHTGYQRLKDPTIHVRRVSFDPFSGHLQCTDRIECNAQHLTERHLHFDAFLSPRLEEGRLVVSLPDRTLVISWNRGTEAELEDSWVSCGYGVRRHSKTLVLRNVIRGTTELELWIQPDTEGVE